MKRHCEGVYLRLLLLQIETAGNSKVCLYSTLRSTFFGYERRYVSLVETRYVKTQENTRIRISQMNLTHGQRTRPANTRMSADAQRDGRPAEYRIPQTNETIAAASGPKLTILCGHVRRYCCLTSFLSDCRIVDTYLRCEDIARENCAMVPRRRFFGDILRPVFSARCVQHVSDLHPKFALRPHHVWKYGRHQISDR